MIQDVLLPGYVDEWKQNRVVRDCDLVAVLCV
jgi:hypothetical protein